MHLQDSSASISHISRVRLSHPRSLVQNEEKRGTRRPLLKNGSESADTFPRYNLPIERPLLSFFAGQRFRSFLFSNPTPSSLCAPLFLVAEERIGRGIFCHLASSRKNRVARGLPGVEPKGERGWRPLRRRFTAKSEHVFLAPEASADNLQ